MTKDIPQSATGHIYRKIKNLLIQSRSRAFQAVNTQMVTCYWHIGRLIVEEEQSGAERAVYGKGLLVELAKKLSAEFGKGFDASNLRNMRLFYKGYPNCDALSHNLSWTHYRILLRVESPDARAFYEAEAINTRWSTRELERQIASLLFDRLALSRDKNGVSDAVVRYTLPEDNNQIFASRYKLYLPTEEELAAEIQKERRFIEMEKRLSDKEEIRTE
ncbi:MAG: DUF1016 N-terminal domain-containing protein [Desulfobacula sp.]|uniref:DUF1016 N-terminal domain-containing protein n=1 Tax=Desulfobacula sp. TaxID=2593537 RepID=UPI0025C1B0DF|nr:DUF1016 N-terminal domain-containing protein [Desulfobacula sp.]MCD4721044.1 DUF1016 N-terminal domain-containing protein [Desulfobacula sp.]